MTIGIVRLRYIYSYRHFHRDNFGDTIGAGWIEPTVKTEHYIVEDKYNRTKDHVEAYVRAMHKDDDQFELLEISFLDIDITGLLRNPVFYLKDL